MRYLFVNMGRQGVHKGHLPIQMGRLGVHMGLLGLYMGHLELHVVHLVFIRASQESKWAAEEFI